MKIAIIGTGYVGLVTAVGLAQLGHQIIGVDRNPDKIKLLNQGHLPFYEPKLDRLLKENLLKKRLSFNCSLKESVNLVDFIFICVGTPPQKDGSADLTDLKMVAQQINRFAKKGKIVVVKSTVPVGTGLMIEKILNGKNGRHFDAISCPEFLREGKAVFDFFHPDRIVVGATKKELALKVLNLFKKIKTTKITTTRATSELIKYASNAFLATKISFINEIGNLCEKVGADVDAVAWGMGLDQRINPYFLQAGIGYGGSCFPKDVRALKQIGAGSGYNFRLLKSVIEVNNRQNKLFLDKIKKVLKNINQKKLAVLGLAFKSQTDDIRESKAITLIKDLVKAGAQVRAYDPQAMPNAKMILPKDVIFCASPYQTLTGADALIVLTEWPIFQKLNWLKVKRLMKKPIIFDGKNLLNKGLLEKLKFKYQGVGK